MKAPTLAFLCCLTSSLASAHAVRAACAADNCARAVTGSALGTATRSAHLVDCQSYLACNVTAGERTTVTSCPTATPAYASGCSGSARYSSACSCFGAAGSTATITIAPTSAVSPTTTPPVAQCTTFDEILLGPDEPVTYRQYFEGIAVTEDTNNPGNDFQTPVTVTYDGTEPKCSAAASCASVGGVANYFSFDLHKFESLNKWQCVLYFDSNRDAAYFDQANGDVVEVYGYSV